MASEGVTGVRTAGTERPPRYRRLLKATLVDVAGSAYPIIIRNVCERGIGATSTHIAPLAGARVRIVLGDKALRDGTVRWSCDSGFGVEFDSPIDIRALSASGSGAAERASPPPNWSVQPVHQVRVAKTDPRRLRSL